MTLADALDRARKTQKAADQGWPKGFSRARVEQYLAPALAVFAAYATTPDRAREIVQALSPASEVQLER